MLSRMLIASAGAGAGELSYWIDRIQTSSTQAPSLRSTVNETNENILVYADANNQGFVELDYDGGLIAARLSTTGSYLENHGTVLSVLDTNYVAHTTTTSSVQINDMPDITASLYTFYGYSMGTYVGSSSYDPASFNMSVYVDIGGGEVFSCIRGGQTAVYFTGYGYFYKPRIHVISYEVTAGSPTGASSEGAFEGVGYQARDAMIARNYSSTTNDHVCFFNEPSISKNVFITYEAKENTAPFSNAREVPYSANQKGRGIFIDSSDKLTAVSAVTTSSTWVFKNLTAGVYYPDRYYSFAHNSTVGNLQSSAMDSDGNIYLLYSNNYLVKYSSANTISWAIQISNSAAAARSGDNLSEVKVESISGEEFLLMSMTFAAESGTYSWYVMKLPLDLDNYLGTYGVITFSSYTFSPTVTLNTFTPTTRSTGLVSGSGSFGIGSTSVASTSVTVTTSTV